jgi:serine/threonine-protein kinase
LALTPGTRLGVYDITAQIGEGGMGQVYRATDTKLKRQVAIKILTPLLAADPDRLARFQREAEVLASLNHSNIAAIYGLEDTDGLKALVLELVEGPTLADRIAAGPVAFDEALPIAKQIAEALEAAHDKGIIHRDLKPANIKLRPDGTVKVLDFGLAKAMEPGSAMSMNAMTSPTLSIHATQAGIILGTAAYMSPEQAAGKPVDKRCDLWAFGVVVMEMLTGRPVFTGETVSHVLAAVLRAEPDWSALPAHTPASIRRMLRRCLDKDRKCRLDSAADARLEIDEALSPAVEASTASVAMTGAAWRRTLPWAVVGALATGLVLMLALWAPWRPAAPPPRVTRTTIAPGPAAISVIGVDGDLALSPDGTHVVYVGNGGTQLFIRALDALEPVAITGGRVLRGPFVSPNGQWVGFVSGYNSLMKVPIAGGTPIAIASLGSTPRGATWAPDDSIIFATGDPSTGLQRVSAGGGTPEVLTRPDHAQNEADHVWPEILPGGHVVLFTITSQTGGLDKAQVVTRDLRTGAQKMLIRGGSHAHYVASGHLVYIAAGTLRAIPFDANRLETRGTAVPIAARVVTTGFGTAEYAVATDGTLVYLDAPGSLAPNARTLVWVDRTGKEAAIAAPPRAYVHPRLSPDGKRVALWIADQEDDIWIWDFARLRLARLTSEPAIDRFPVWTRDGQRIVFASSRAGALNFWSQAADGSGIAERLTTSSNNQFPTGITPDGKAVVFNELTPTMGSDLLQVALDGTHHVTPLLQTKFDEFNGVVSPDGRWLAYDSNSSGDSSEIYVRPFPGVGGGQSPVSTAGGTRPLWARNGKELFYVGADGALWRVPVEASDQTWNAGTPTKLFDARYFIAGTSGRTYDVSPDGQRFLMIKAPGSDAGVARPTIIVVQHWDEELRRLAPTK